LLREQGKNNRTPTAICEARTRRAQIRREIANSSPTGQEHGGQKSNEHDYTTGKETTGEKKSKNGKQEDRR
jgi:hypothetical protein